MAFWGDGYIVINRNPDKTSEPKKEIPNSISYCEELSFPGNEIHTNRVIW
jgi:hypothetical protein